MILSDKDIAKAMQAGQITISPPPAQIDPCSVDLRLGNTFRVFDPNAIGHIDTRNAPNTMDYSHTVQIGRDYPFVLHPGGFVLATTMECVELGNDIVGRLEGRSSLARLGIIIHSTAGRIDPGWEGYIVLELGNVGVFPVALYAGDRVCALMFEQLSSPAQPYSLKPDNKYSMQSGPVGSKIEGG